MPGLLWFKRDLRLEDHPALAAAAGAGDVLPVYIVEPEYWHLPDTSGRQWDFTRDCVADLAARCPLVVRVGRAETILAELAQTHGITRLFSHEETGNLWTFARDRRVADWAGQAGVTWTELPQSGVTRRLASRDGWAKAREDWIRQPRVLAGQVRWLTAASDPLPTSEGLRLTPDPCPGRQIGGRDPAMAMLGGFLTERGRTYRKSMSSPLQGEWACSRLSPYLALGVLSGREAAQAAAARKAEETGRTGWKGSLTSFTSRLAWRDHFMQKLEDEPQIETCCLHTAYQGLRGDDPVRFEAWATGQTGLPFVDACMRYLIHGGWLNFRMRSMLMAVASYHLWLDWRATGLHMARMFTDYEPGIHWSQTQMQSGTTGMNTVRIYNPVKQGKDQDPEGRFTRRWVPELADVPLGHLQEPWTAGGVTGYPAPLVDVAQAAREARDRIFAVRRGEAFRSEAQAIVKKHASRKKDRGFQRDPVPSRDPKPKDDRQMSLDL